MIKYIAILAFLTGCATTAKTLTPLENLLEAEANFKKVVANNPKYADAWFQLGLTEMYIAVLMDNPSDKTYRKQLAREAFDKCLEIEPDNVNCKEGANRVPFDPKVTP